MAAAQRKVNCYGSNAWLRWIERAAHGFGISAAELIGRSLESFATANKMASPPRRLDPDAHRKAARRRAATTPR